MTVYMTLEVELEKKNFFSLTGSLFSSTLCTYFLKLVWCISNLEIALSNSADFLLMKCEEGYWPLPLGLLVTFEPLSVPFTPLSQELP